VNPYQELGVGPRASQTEIKAAYKRQASERHPDRDGGSDEAMSRLNVAYAIVGDPKRRARYDRTGSEGLERTVEERAADQAMSGFMDAIAHGHTDPVYHARAFLRLARDNARAQLASAREAPARLATLRERVRRKENAANLYRQVIDGQIEMAARALETLPETIEVLERAIEIVNDHEASVRADRDRLEMLLRR